MTDPIEITTEIAALPARVGGFFTDPARFEQWFGQGSAIDPRPGGAFRVAYPGGAAAIRPVVEIGPERVVLTWGFEGGPVLPPGASTVTFTISSIPSGFPL